MSALEKELQERKSEIENELELLFKANIKITDWDIPEVDDKEVATKILEIMKNKLNKIEQDIESGKYNY